MHMSGFEVVAFHVLRQHRIINGPRKVLSFKGSCFVVLEWNECDLAVVNAIFHIREHRYINIVDICIIIILI